MFKESDSRDELNPTTDILTTFRIRYFESEKRSTLKGSTFYW